MGPHSRRPRRGLLSREGSPSELGRPLLWFSVVIATLTGYVVFALVVILIIALMTAYLVWYSRTVGKKWWKRARDENDPARRK